MASALAVALALVSSQVERSGPELVRYGNLCGASSSDACYRPALKGGFPFAYLVDTPGVSVERRLSFGEDEFRVGAFVGDGCVYFALVSLLLALGRRWSARQAPGRSGDGR